MNNNPVAKPLPRKSILGPIFQRNDAKKKATSISLLTNNPKLKLIGERKSAFQNLTSKFLKINNILKKRLCDLRKRAGTGSLVYLSEKQADLLSEQNLNIQLNYNPVIGHFETFSKFTKSLLNPTYKNLKKHLVNNYVVKNTRSYYRKILKLLPCFRRPSGLYKLIWDGVSVIMVMITIFVFSISLFFGISKEKAYSFSDESINASHGSFKYFIAANLVLVFLNIYFGFQTPFYLNGELITDKFAIRKYYKKNFFILDLLSLVPYFLYVIPDVDNERDGRLFALRLIDALVFIRLRELYLFFQNIEAVISLNEKFESIFELFKLICSVLLITHFVGCFWYLIGATSEAENSNSWIDRVPPHQKSWFDLYSQSIYWALTTIATVGYGDITPQTIKERFFCMLIMIAGSAIFGYSVNKIGGILDNLNQKKANLKKSIKIIDIYMKNLNIAYDLQLKIKKYLEFSFRKESTFINKAQDIVLEKLNHSLKNELLEYAYGGFINSIPLFSKYFSPLTLKNLNRIIKTKNSSPGEILVKRETHDSSLYFIVDGAFEIVYSNEDRMHKLKLNKGDFFGEYSFFTGFPPLKSIRSLAYSTLYCIERDDFLEALQHDKDDYYKYCEIRDKLTLRLDITPISKPCIFCGEKTHLISECPSMYYRPKVQIVVLKHLYSPFQKRAKLLKFSRRKKRGCHHALGHAKSIHNRNIEFRSTKNIDLVSMESVDYNSDENLEPLLELNQNPHSDNFFYDPSPSALISQEERRNSIADVPQLPSPNFIENMNSSIRYKLREPSLEKQMGSSLEIFPNDIPSKHDEKREISFKQELMENPWRKQEIETIDRLMPFPGGKLITMEKIKLPSPMKIPKLGTQEQIEIRKSDKNIFNFEITDLGTNSTENKKPTMLYNNNKKRKHTQNKQFERSNSRGKSIINHIMEENKGSVYSKSETFQADLKLLVSGNITANHNNGLRSFDLFAKDMDVIKCFNSYMPHNNIEVVIKSLKKVKENKRGCSFVGTQGSKKFSLKPKIKVTNFKAKD